MTHNGDSIIQIDRRLQFRWRFTKPIDIYNSVSNVTGWLS